MSPPLVTGGAADAVRVLVPDIATLTRRLTAVAPRRDETLPTSLFLGTPLPPPRLPARPAAAGHPGAAGPLSPVAPFPNFIIINMMG